MQFSKVLYMVTSYTKNNKALILENFCCVSGSVQNAWALNPKS
jgi:hypothetical protein